MRKAWNTFKIRIVGSLLVGALAITLCLVSTMLQNGYLQLGTYFAGMFATAVFIGLSVWLSVLIWSNWGTRGTSPTVIGTLLSALRRDPNPRVRLEAAKGLAELDVERSSLHERHRELDEALVSALEHDSDPRVRSKAAEGLGKLEQEKSSYYHKHHDLDDLIYRPKL